MNKILIADDNKLILKIFKIYCRNYAIIPVFASNGYDAIQKLQCEAFFGLITDLQMPFVDGYELIQHCILHYPTLPIVVITGDDSFLKTSILQSPQILGVFTKPFRYQDIFELFKMSPSNDSTDYLEIK